MTRPPYDWLPDRHLGTAAALAHADAIIGQISDLLLDYQTVPDGVIGLRNVVVGDVVRTVVESLAPIPRKVPLLVADVLVVMRNALEHTLFAEVEFLDGRLAEDSAKRVEIPATTCPEDFEKWVAARGKKAPPSLTVGSDLVARIERLQPYHLPGDPARHPLARLVLHTNHAKHREPAITSVRIAAMYEDESRPESIHELEERPEVPVLVGDVIGEVPVGKVVPITMFPTIGINRPGTDLWPVLMTELDEIFKWVRTQALPRLVTGGDPPQPSLPCRYEVSLGHDDERAAIAQGSDVSAAHRHGQRLTAASARLDLAEIITEFDSEVPDEQVIEWLDLLSDDEVNARAERLGARPQLPPPTRARYIRRILGELRDEAVTFAQRDD
ncbi:hypothetical protein [Rhodococcus globerulus]|uniref:hypothetical protein n=1 Tax=Rhodococcus globerulus TaxID=33008 RepID=UPI00301898C3